MALLAKHYRSDARLIQRILRGDRDLFAILVSRYTRPSYAIAYAHLGNAHDAEDTTQEAFLRAFRDLNRLDDPARFGQWLLSIVRHISVDRIRRAIRERRLLDEAEDAREAAVPDPGRAELHALLRTRVDGLKVEHREALSLHYFAGKSTREIAELLGESRETVKKRLQRAREELSQSLVADLDDVLRVPRSDVKRIERRTSRAILALPVAWDSGASIPHVAVPRGWHPGTLPLSATIAGGVVVVAVSLTLFLSGGRVNDGGPSEEPAAQHVAVDSGETELAARGDAEAKSGPPSPASTAPASPSTHRGRGGIVGRVAAREEGTAARVVAERIDWEKHETPDEMTVTHEIHADASGHYAFAGLEPGFYVVHATTDQAMGVAATTIVGEEAQPVGLDLQSAEVLEGQVFYSDGTPAAGAWVYPREHLESRSLWSGHSTGLRVRTRDDGSFRFPMLWRGHWRVTVKADGAATYETQPFATGGDPAVITLAGSGGLRGSVVDATTGAPVEGVHVVVPGQVRRDFFEVVTDANGSYEVSGMMAGGYHVRVFDGRYIPKDGHKVATVEVDSVSTVPTFEVLEGGRVIGRVIDAATGAGISGVTITVDDAPAVPVESDADGRFTVGGISDGTQNVRILEARGYQLSAGQTARRIAVRHDVEPAVVEFALRKGRIVRGVVTDAEGSALAGARVDIGGLSGGALATAFTGFDGEFTADGIAAETPLYLVASHERGASQTTGPLLADSSGDWPCTLVVEPSASVGGEVVAIHGEPLPNWSVLAMREGGGAGTIAQAGEAGAFRFASLPTGAYALFGVPPGAQLPMPDARPVRVLLRDGGMVNGVRVMCEAGLTISGHVQGSIQSVRGGVVEATGPVTRTATTDDAGDYVLHGLVEGEYDIRVTSSTCCSAEHHDVPAGATGVDFQMVTRGSVAGRVVDAQTRKAVTSFQAGFGVGSYDLIPPDMEPWLVHTRDAHGAFRLDFVDAGAVTVMVRASGYVDGTFVISNLAEEEALEGITIALERGGHFFARVVDIHGAAIEHAGVFLGELPNMASGAIGAIAYSDADGYFSLSSLPSSGAGIWIAHPAYAAMHFEVETRLIGTQGMRIVMQQGVTLEGRILTDEPLPGVSLVLIDSTGAPRSLQIDEGGTFRTPPLEPGEYVVQASVHDGAGRAVRTITRREVVLPGAPVVFDWGWAAATATVAGSIDTGGGGVGSVALYVDCGTETESIAVDVQGDGTFASALAPAGPATLVIDGVRKDGAAWHREIPCTLRPGETLMLDLTGG